MASLAPLMPRSESAPGGLLQSHSVRCPVPCQRLRRERRCVPVVVRACTHPMHFGSEAGILSIATATSLFRPRHGRRMIARYIPDLRRLAGLLGCTKSMKPLPTPFARQCLRQALDRRLPARLNTLVFSRPTHTNLVVSPLATWGLGVGMPEDAACAQVLELILKTSGKTTLLTRLGADDSHRISLPGRRSLTNVCLMCWSA